VSRYSESSDEDFGRVTENTADARPVLLRLVGDLHQAAGALAKRVEIVSERLAPIRLSVPKPVGVDSDPPQKELRSPLAAEIADAITMLRITDGRLAAIMSEVEL